MAINPDSLKLRTGNTSITMSGTRFTMSKAWEVYHSALDEVITSGIEAISIPALTALDNADLLLEGKAETHLEYLKELHKPLTIIEDHSVFDADLILDRWLQDEGGLAHPLCGDIIAMPSDLISRVNVILSECLSPPVWFWADSPSVGQLHVKSVVVPGATSYRVYNGDELIASPSGAESTFAVSPGDYVIRMAGYDSRLGILSFPISVTVLASGMVGAVEQPWYSRVLSRFR